MLQMNHSINDANSVCSIRPTRLAEITDWLGGTGDRQANFNIMMPNAAIDDIKILDRILPRSDVIPAACGMPSPTA